MIQLTQHNNRSCWYFKLSNERWDNSRLSNAGLPSVTINRLPRRPGCYINGTFVWNNLSSNLTMLIAGKRQSPIVIFLMNTCCPGVCIWSPRVCLRWRTENEPSIVGRVVLFHGECHSSGSSSRSLRHPRTTARCRRSDNPESLCLCRGEQWRRHIPRYDKLYTSCIVWYGSGTYHDKTMLFSFVRMWHIPRSGQALPGI